MIREITNGKEQVIRKVEDWNARKVTHPESTVIRYWNDALTEEVAQAVIQDSYIFYVIVNPSYRQQGYGARVVEDAVSMIKGDAYLIPQDNQEHLIHFYEKLGFKENSRNESGEVIMVKKANFTLNKKHPRAFKELKPGKITFKYKDEVLLTTTIKTEKREDQQLSMAWNFALKERKYPFQRWICEKEQNGWTLKDFKENVVIEQN